MAKKGLLLTICFLLVFGVTSQVFSAQYDLTGVWTCDDGGKFYIRQIGNKIWWFGEDKAKNPTYSNVAYGTISGNTIKLKWADVPKGGIIQDGTLVIKVRSNNKLVAVEKTGGFGGNEWTR